MRNRALASAAVIFFASGAARAQDDGCRFAPSLTPARDTSADLRCFPQRIALANGAVRSADRTSPLSIVLASVGGAGVATFIGFGVAGQSQLVNGAIPATAWDSVRVDYAVANVALSIGLTALVAGVVLMLTHH